MAKTCLVVSRFGNFSFSLEGHIGVCLLFIDFSVFSVEEENAEVLAFTSNVKSGFCMALLWSEAADIQHNKKG